MLNKKVITEARQVTSQLSARDTATAVVIERALSELEQEVKRLSDSRVYKVETLDDMGRMVREIWLKFAREQARKTGQNQTAKPSHLVGWDDLDEANREVDRQIGNKLFSFAFERGFAAGVQAFLENEAEEGEAGEREGTFGCELNQTDVQVRERMTVPGSKNPQKQLWLIKTSTLAQPTRFNSDKDKYKGQ